MMQHLRDQIASVLDSKPARISLSEAEQITDRSVEAPLWVTKWIDWSRKYGLGYEICDGGIGFMFKDNTHLTKLPGQYSLYYLRDGRTTYYHTFRDFRSLHRQKCKVIVALIRVIESYGPVPAHWRVPIMRTPYVNQWFRKSSSIIFGFTNGSVQITFFDRTKIILCALNAAVTWINEMGQSRTHRFKTIQNKGCMAELRGMLYYAHEQIGAMTDSSGCSHGDVFYLEEKEKARINCVAIVRDLN